jgi:methionyl-tRNA formyltransferase
MNKEQLRIVFMGTPEFAVASLQALVNNNFNVVGVITSPDKPSGRGMQLQQSAVKQYALANNLTVLQPEKLKNPDFIATLKELKADIQIVVAFRMLPEIVWNMPPMGTVNVHGSLLPQYRGAAPINWAIINGETETGVTTFKLKHEIDTGDILLQSKFSITQQDNAGTIHDTMKEVGAQLLIKTIDGLLNNSITEQPQITAIDTKHAPKIFTETCLINWHKTSQECFNLIRGLSPYPAAFTKVNNKILKIHDCSFEICNTNTEPSNIHTDNKTYLKFATTDGYINCLTIQMEGKKKMPIADFLRGNSI